MTTHSMNPMPSLNHEHVRVRRLARAVIAARAPVLSDNGPNRARQAEQRYHQAHQPPGPAVQRVEQFHPIASAVAAS